jgi:hypothetical protein
MRGFIANPANRYWKKKKKEKKIKKKKEKNTHLLRQP